MKIEDHNDINILFFAFRYALGRRTGAPGIVISKIKNNWTDLQLEDREQILRETNEYLEREMGTTMAVSDFNIYNNWIEFKEWCTKKIREDKIDTMIKSKTSS